MLASTILWIGSNDYVKRNMTTLLKCLQMQWAFVCQIPSHPLSSPSYYLCPLCLIDGLPDNVTKTMHTLQWGRNLYVVILDGQIASNMC